MIKELEGNDPELLFEAEANQHRAFEKIGLNISDPRVAIKIVAPAILGCILIWFGLTTTGSYFESASRFGGFLATIWYGWQLGTFIAIAGGIMIYDAIKRTGYL